MAEDSSSRLVFAIALLSLFSAGLSIDDKCAACTAIAERPRNHLDMRHRLDAKGQRQGKVIDYRVSELRVVDLLDGLCEKMQDYTLEKVDSSTQVWMKVDNWDILKTNRQEARAHSKAISSFCGRLLEETEDELSELIKKGSVKAGSVSKVLCEDLGRYCDQPSDDDGKVMDEL
ncbi:uncharacterized protein [Coffea arabica]|uniref:Uncharacterized protein isoform X2 n=1 Tax=Coffea arabica TaxID=13443 RepID=A0ABM4U234_COFAR